MASCVHRWRIDSNEPENIIPSPSGGLLNGKCHYCGEQRLHRASLDNWGSDLNWLYQNDPALKLAVAPL